MSDRALVVVAAGAWDWRRPTGSSRTPDASRRGSRVAPSSSRPSRCARCSSPPPARPPAWIAYGVSFWLLARAILPLGAEPSLLGCITLYTCSYLSGWFNPMPAGIGVTEPVMVLLGPQFGVASTAEMTVLALFARAVRTVLEMGPSLVALGIASMVHRDGAGESGANL